MATAATMMKQVFAAAAARSLVKVSAASDIKGSAKMMTSAPVVCGRGDKRTKKGKRFKGSYGNSRPKKDKMIERIKDRVEVPRSTPWPLPFKLI